ncbi:MULTISPECIES: ATPase inhibitor subunit zeta [unclassified Aureimonas]|uniref:ATPase inhibitor subunit zeta n=1 Tax=unclassified Aureimonas TaxID=2615206 RepID=UPI00138EE3C7|nr:MULTISPECIES: ATPase inhibitor subunit zeta [unclassified Aureimonas]
MKSIQHRTDMAERSFLLTEERSFHSRAKVDRDAGLWIAGRLGLAETDAAKFAEETVAAGVRSTCGRGGFDYLALMLDDAGLHVEELRTRYAIALAAASLPPLVFSAAPVLHA